MVMQGRGAGVALGARLALGRRREGGVLEARADVVAAVSAVAPFGGRLGAALGAPVEEVLVAAVVQQGRNVLKERQKVDVRWMILVSRFD